MMLGTCDVEKGIVITHKTTYVLSSDTKPDVRRMLFGPGILIASGLSFMGFGFADVLYAHEIGLIAVAAVASSFGGSQFARLVILDRVTRGTEQETANYGLHSTLQAKRQEINIEINRIKNTSTSSNEEQVL